MPQTQFTLEQDKQLIAAILTLSTPKIAAAILFLLIRDMPDRVRLLTYLAGL
jgi:hypothetical protein